MPVEGVGRPGLQGVSTIEEGGAAAQAVEGAVEAGEARGVSSLGPEGADLEALSRGEIDLPQYLDRQVEAATRHLEGKLPQAELLFVKENLLASFESDPVVARLLSQITAQSARPSE